MRWTTLLGFSGGLARSGCNVKEFRVKGFETLKSKT